MRKHTKIYFDYFGYDISDIILCEICNSVAVDLHHIEPRSMGGNPKGDKDVIENIMALCRSCHIKYEGNKKDKDMLKVVHLIKMNERKQNNKKPPLPPPDRLIKEGEVPIPPKSYNERGKH